MIDDKLFIADCFLSKVRVFNIKTGELIKDIPVGVRADNLDVDPVSGNIYVGGGLGIYKTVYNHFFEHSFGAMKTTGGISVLDGKTLEAEVLVVTDRLQDVS